MNQRELTEEGLEKNFATNTLGKVFLNSSSSVIPEFMYRVSNNTLFQYLTVLLGFFLQKLSFF